MLGLAVAGFGLPWSLRLRAAGPVTDWPEWKDFVSAQLQGDGRITDFITADRRTTSEAQSYGMFFALVANDPVLFQRLWQWTCTALIPDPDRQPLPAWLWGQPDGAGGRILDPNSASDADLWMAYALIEAGRLWRHEAYRQAGRGLLQALLREECAVVPGLGAMPLPGRIGFAGPGHWRLNPSYLPLQLLRRCAEELPQAPLWSGLPERVLRLVKAASPHGYAPDWVPWNGPGPAETGSDPVIGSWDAIRTYLWAGMLADEDPLRMRLLQALQGPVDSLRRSGRLAERVDVRRGTGQGDEPRGYAGALLPYLQALDEPALLAAQRSLIPAVQQYRQTGLPYYERILILFGLGWQQQRFRFGVRGHLLPAWQPLLQEAT